MTALPELTASLPLLFLIAVIGIGSPLFTLPGLFPADADHCPDFVKSALGTGLQVAVFALPGGLAAQIILRVLHGVVPVALLGPLVLLALFSGISFLLRRISDSLKSGLAERQPSGYARIYLLAGALALYPAMDRGLSAMAFLPSAVFLLGSCCGCVLLLALLGAIRDRMQTAGIPACMQGTPALLVAAGLVGLAGAGLIRLVN